MLNFEIIEADSYLSILKVTANFLKLNNLLYIVLILDYELKKIIAKIINKLSSKNVKICGVVMFKKIIYRLIKIHQIQ